MQQLASATWQPWPYTGDSFNIALTAVCLTATNVAGFAARLYVLVRHRRGMQNLAPTILLCGFLVFMLAQGSVLIRACYYGWGSAISTLPPAILHKAEVSFLTSNILFVIVLGFSRACIGATLLQASATTWSRKLAFGILCAIPLWTVASVLAVALNRLSGPSYWLPVGQDCSFALWGGTHLVGLLIDIAVSACGVKLTVPLQMALAKKLFTIFAFSVGILVNIPLAYALSSLANRSSEIARDPTLYSSSFIVANQAAIAVSLWCRVVEAVRKLGRDMGYATYGHKGGASSLRSRTKRSTSKGVRSSGRSRTQRSANTAPGGEDEIELRPEGEGHHTAEIEGGKMRGDRYRSRGIQISREYGYSEQDRSEIT